VIVENTLKEYYQHAELTVPENSKFHHFRFRLQSGSWLGIKDTVRSPEDLRRWLLILTPMDVYNSANCFLNPSSMSYVKFDGKKAGWNISSNIMLWDGAIVLDTDFHIRTFNEAKRDALVILDYLYERGYAESEVKFTGQGFQTIVEKHELHLPRVSPKARFNLYREKRKHILKDLQERGVQVDEEILLDAKRITRTIGTVNSKNGCVCTRVRDLEGFEETEAVKLNLEGNAPTSPTRAMTNFFYHEKEAVGPHWCKGEHTRRKESKPDQIGSANSALEPSPTLYLGSITIGTCDRQIIMLRFKSDVALTQLKENLSRFAIHEQLAPFLIFKSAKDPEGLWALSPTAVQTSGMKRLLRRFPRDSNVYVRFHRRIVPLPIEYVAQSSGVTNSEIPVSASHYKYLTHYGLLENFVPKVLCGSPNLLSTPIGEMNS